MPCSTPLTRIFGWLQNLPSLWWLTQRRLVHKGMSPFVESRIRCIAAAGIVVFHLYWHCVNKAVLYIVPPTTFSCPSFLLFIFHGGCNHVWRYAAPSRLSRPLLAIAPAAYFRIKISWHVRCPQPATSRTIVQSFGYDHAWYRNFVESVGSEWFNRR